MAGCFRGKVKDDATFSRSVGYINPMGGFENNNGSVVYSNVDEPETPTDCNLHDVLSTCNFPLQVKVVDNEDQIVFLGNPNDRSVQTILANIRVDRVKCLSNNDQYIYMPLDIPKPVMYTQIDNSIDLVSVCDIIKYKAKQKLSWLVVTKRFEYKSSVYEAGDILEIDKSSLSKRIIRMLSKKRWRDQLSVISHPSRCKSKLPSYVQGNFKKCRSPYSSCYLLISDLMENKETPFLMTLPKDVIDAMRGTPVKSGQRVLALEQISHNIIFMADANNDIIVQAIPTTIPVNIEVINDTSSDISSENVNINKYRESLIANIETIQCCPVYLSELFPPSTTRDSKELSNNSTIPTRSRGRVSHKSNSWSEIKSKQTRPSINQTLAKLNRTSSPPVPSPRVNSRKRNEPFNPELYYATKEAPPVPVRESPPIPVRKSHPTTKMESQAIPPARGTTPIQKTEDACEAVGLFPPINQSSDGDYLKAVSDNDFPVYNGDYLKAVTDKDSPVIFGDYLKAVTDKDSPTHTLYTEIEQHTRKGNHMHTELVLKSITIGKDGYVIVPPVGEENISKSPVADEINSQIVASKASSDKKIGLNKNNSFSTKLDLLYEAKFGSPPSNASSMDFRPTPSPRPSLFPSHDGIRPIPMPRHSKMKL